MRLRTARHLPPAAKINVTPLIDVVMVLIIFYLIVANLGRAPLPRVALPDSRSGLDEADRTPFVITVLPSARVIADGLEVAPEDLPALLRSKLPDPAAAVVHLRADRDMPYARVAPIIDACREAGLTSVKLVARRGDAP